MGITIDEIIAKETEIAQEFQKVVDTHIVNNDGDIIEEMYCDDTEVIEEHLQRCKDFADYHNQIANTIRKYQQLQADYENRLKADMVAMLTDLLIDVEEIESREQWCDYANDNCISRYDVEDLIQQKINSLKETKDENEH